MLGQRWARRGSRIFRVTKTQNLTSIHSQAGSIRAFRAEDSPSGRAVSAATKAVSRRASALVLVWLGGGTVRSDNRKRPAAHLTDLTAWREGHLGSGGQPHPWSSDRATGRGLRGAGGTRRPLATQNTSGLHRAGAGIALGRASAALRLCGTAVCVCVRARARARVCLIVLEYHDRAPSPV